MGSLLRVWYLSPGGFLMSLSIDLFDYFLPENRIAQNPIEPRDHSKLLLCKPDENPRLESSIRLGQWNVGVCFEDLLFYQLEQLLSSSDWLVVNNTKVLPVRLLGKRKETAGEVEAVLLKEISEIKWTAILHLSAKVKPGILLEFEPGLIAEIQSTHEQRVQNNGEVVLEFSGPCLEKHSLKQWLQVYGHVPLPPYVSRKDEEKDKKTYQTVYAAQDKINSAAAPTAGFHFTQNLLEKLEKKGVVISKLTLDIGIGTFRPIKSHDIESHEIHEESFHISSDFAKQFIKAKRQGKRVVAVGTTSLRALESWAQICKQKNIELGTPESVGCFSSKLFIKPGFSFSIADDLITNFHLPRSTLLVLVAAAMGGDRASGIEAMKKTYEHALAHNYRFYSYGDAMFIQGR